MVVYLKLAIMSNWKKKAVLGFACAAALGAASLATTTQASADTVKTIQSGDTLWGISQTTGQSVDNLKSANHLTSDTIHVGQRLTIGDSTATAPANTTTGTVKVVQSGDTLWGISQATGQSVDDLKSANHLTSDMIYVGQRLMIGGSTATAPAATSAPVQSTTTPAQPTPAPAQSTPAPAPAQATPAPQTQAPVQQTQAPAQQTSAPAQTQQTQAPAQPASTPVQSTTTPAANDSSAKNWIAQRESGGSYTAQNGQYYGKYQLSSSYLHGDYSAANQERVADSYVNSRYGSWENAKQHWVANGWY